MPFNFYLNWCLKINLAVCVQIVFFTLPVKWQCIYKLALMVNFRRLSYISAIGYQELHEWLPKGHFHVVSKRNAFFVCFPPCCGSSPQILYVADIFSRFLRKKAGRRGELLLSWCDDGPLEFWLCVGSQQSSQEEIHKVDLVLQMLAESSSTIRFFSPFL